MKEIRIVDAEPNMDNPLAKSMVDYMVEQGKIAINKDYENMKKQILHNGICEEDAELIVATIKRLRG